jgi:hypothetical protein
MLKEILSGLQGGSSMQRYPERVELHMRRLFESLSEKDRRRYAAVEAEKLGHGGGRYIADVLGCDEDTIHQGQLDIEQLPVDAAAGRVRKKGRPPESCHSTTGLA